METCKVFEFKIADNEEDGEDPGDEDLEQMFSFDLNKEMHPVVECFHKCLQAENEEPLFEERRFRLTREYLLGTSERCRGFLLWTNNLHRWQLYQPDLVHHFIDVCLEDLDCQLGEPTASIFWWMAGLLHEVYPWPELRLRIARRMMDIGGVAKELFAWHWTRFANFSLSINASTSICWQSSSGL